MMQIVEELKIYKESTGKKATDIAREMGMPTRTVQNWLNGDYNPTPKNSVAIFNYLTPRTLRQRRTPQRRPRTRSFFLTTTLRSKRKRLEL